MANYEKDNTGKILLGFLIGATAGAIAGILLAPDKGQNTRRSITDASTKFKADLNSQLERGRDKLNSLKEEVLSKVGYDESSKNGRRSPVGEEGNSGNF